MKHGSLFDSLATINDVAAIIRRVNSGGLSNDPEVIAVKKFFVDDEARAYAIGEGILRGVGVLPIEESITQGAEAMK